MGELTIEFVNLWDKSLEMVELWEKKQAVREGWGDADQVCRLLAALTYALLAQRETWVPVERPHGQPQ